MSLASLGFAHGWVLWAAALVPLLYLLLRTLPPAPRRIVLPTLVLLRTVAVPLSRARPPWWLMALRMALAACIIVAISGPVWNAPTPAAGPRDLVVVVENGWASAASLAQSTALAQPALDQTAAAGGRVVLFAAAAEPDAGVAPAVWLAPNLARAALTQLDARAWDVDRARTAARVRAAMGQTRARILWLSDGLDPATADDFARQLAGIGPVSIIPPPPGGPLAFRNIAARPGSFRLDVVFPAQTAARAFTVVARARNGDIVATTDVTAPPAARHVLATLAVPDTEQVRVDRLEIAGQRSAAAVYLLDDAAARPVVGLFTADGEANAQPLRAAAYYLSRALAPHAAVRSGTIAGLLAQGVNILMLADIGAVSDADRNQISAFMTGGGVLIQFAGPRLVQSAQTLLPVSLLPAPRELQSTLAWNGRTALAPFGAGTPFAGLAVPADLVVRRQALPDPARPMPAATWAQLTDGTPLVTAAPRGSGWNILVHVTAGPDWSDLPLSGLFEQMLVRMLPLARPAAGVRSAAPGVFTLTTELMGSGQAEPAARRIRLPATTDFAASRISPATPAGRYQSGTQLRALNLASAAGPIGPQFAFAPITTWPAGTTLLAAAARPAISFGPALWQLALLLLAADALATLHLRGLLAWRGLTRRSSPALLLALMFVSVTARAQPAERASVQIGYVLPPAAAGGAAASGMATLTSAVRQRTAITVGVPRAITLGRDQLDRFALIYWPLSAAAPPLAGAALADLERYIEQGGQLLIDTHAGGDTADAQAAAATRQLRQLNLPKLAPLTAAHVLAKSFYLLARAPGFAELGPVWLEADTAARDAQVSSVFIGAQDWGQLWSGAAGPQAQEAALRFGINLLMYSLTGTYKTDQVHIETLLQRIQPTGGDVKRVP